MIEATEQTFGQLVEQAKGLVLVDFQAAWCGPCKAMVPLLEQLGRQRPDLTITSVDFDRSPNIAVKYDVRALPTLILFRDGKAIGQHIGTPGSQGELERMIENAVGRGR